VENRVSRVIAFSLALCLTAGQDAVALCRAWCGVQETGSSTCGQSHDSDRAVLRELDHCADADPAPTVLVRADIRPPLVPVLQVQAAPESSGTLILVRHRLGPEPGPPLTGPHHARSVLLRI
jgi:hypothetical protein